MTEYLVNIVWKMRPAFSRKAAFSWFVIVFAGLILKEDSLGVTSIIRGILLPAVCYPSIIHFFHSQAWRGDLFLKIWWKILIAEEMAHVVNERIVLIGDHTMKAKEGRKMPSVRTQHQNSETNTKPSFFRGHEWGFIALLSSINTAFHASPLWAGIHRKGEYFESNIEKMIAKAHEIADYLGKKAYLVLDAFFVSKKSFIKKDKIDVIVRGKKNAVAYFPPVKRKKKGRGRPKKYGKKVKIINLFESKKNSFSKTTATIYGKTENIRYLKIALMWRPVKSMICFLLYETPRGKIILMSSDLNICPINAIELYASRMNIETMFDSMKNLLNGFGYHFWSKYLSRASRRPCKNENAEQKSSNPEKTEITFFAIERFVWIQMIVLGMLHLFAKKFHKEIYSKFTCWLRTESQKTPSEFVTISALKNLLKRNLLDFENDPITQLIHSKTKQHCSKKTLQKVA